MKTRKIITIGTIILLALSLSACGNSTSNSSSSNHSTQSAKKHSEFHKVGDSVKVGQVTYTLKSVETVSERNEFADKQPKHVIKVVYHIKNHSDKDIPVGTDLNAYGPDNNKLESYPISGATLGSIAPGKEMDVVDGFGTDNLGNIELQFAPLVSTAKAAKFKVKVKDTVNNNEATSQDSTTNQAPTQQSVQNNQIQNSTQSDQTLSDYVNQYGESPTATKVKEGMSQEDALKTTPNDMKTSGEIQQQWLNDN